MESVGSKLKRLRLQKGLSLEEASKKTKIHLNILKAIEEDSLTNISPIYIKGFLKIYGQFLGANPQDYISDYKVPQGQPPVILRSPEKPVSSFKTTSPKLGSFGKKLNIKKVVFLFLAILIVVSIGLFTMHKIMRFKAVHAPKKLSGLAFNKIEKQPPITKSEKKGAARVLTKTVASEANLQKEVASGVRLVIKAKENCWMLVKVDGQVVFQNILRKGRFESWQAKDKIELSLGNAGAVDLELNSKLIPSLGRKGQAIKKILITKEGLSVGR